MFLLCMGSFIKYECNAKYARACKTAAINL